MELLTIVCLKNGGLK